MIVDSIDIMDADCPAHLPCNYLHAVISVHRDQHKKVAGQIKNDSLAA